MKKLALTILMMTLAACSARRDASEAGKDPYAGLWNMLVLSTPPEIKGTQEAARPDETRKAAFKDASHSTGKGKIATGTA
ncbi:MAG: hypothetical protein HQK99_04960 [Nitrospirae bacterium]|nr:hypothetical protein [Nitrospirota bacterium]